MKPLYTLTESYSEEILLYRMRDMLQSGFAKELAYSQIILDESNDLVKKWFNQYEQTIQIPNNIIDDIATAIITAIKRDHGAIDHGVAASIEESKYDFYTLLLPIVSDGIKNGKRCSHVFHLTDDIDMRIEFIPSTLSRIMKRLSKETLPRLTILYRFKGKDWHASYTTPFNLDRTREIYAEITENIVSYEAQKNPPWIPQSTYDAIARSASATPDIISLLNIENMLRTFGMQETTHVLTSFSPRAGHLSKTDLMFYLYLPYRNEYCILAKHGITLIENVLPLSSVMCPAPTLPYSPLEYPDTIPMVVSAPWAKIQRRNQPSGTQFLQQSPEPVRSINVATTNENQFTSRIFILIVLVIIALRLGYISCRGYFMHKFALIKSHQNFMKEIEQLKDAKNPEVPFARAVKYFKEYKASLKPDAPEHMYAATLLLYVIHSRLEDPLNLGKRTGKTHRAKANTLTILRDKLGLLEKNNTYKKLTFNPNTLNALEIECKDCILEETNQDKPSWNNMLKNMYQLLVRSSNEYRATEDGQKSRKSETESLSKFNRLREQIPELYNQINLLLKSPPMSLQTSREELKKAYSTFYNRILERQMLYKQENFPAMLKINKPSVEEIKSLHIRCKEYLQPVHLTNAEMDFLEKLQQDYVRAHTVSDAGTATLQKILTALAALQESIKRQQHEKVEDRKTLSNTLCELEKFLSIAINRAEIEHYKGRILRPNQKPKPERKPDLEIDLPQEEPKQGLQNFLAHMGPRCLSIKELDPSRLVTDLKITIDRSILIRLHGLYKEHKDKARNFQLDDNLKYEVYLDLLQCYRSLETLDARFKNNGNQLAHDYFLFFSSSNQARLTDKKVINAIGALFDAIATQLDIPLPQKLRDPIANQHKQLVRYNYFANDIIVLGIEVQRALGSLPSNRLLDYLTENRPMLARLVMLCEACKNTGITVEKNQTPFSTIRNMLAHNSDTTHDKFITMLQQDIQALPKVIEAANVQILASLESAL